MEDLGYSTQVWVAKNNGDVVAFSKNTTNSASCIGYTIYSYAMKESKLIGYERIKFN